MVGNEERRWWLIDEKCCVEEEKNREREREKVYLPAAATIGEKKRTCCFKGFILELGYLWVDPLSKAQIDICSHGRQFYNFF